MAQPVTADVAARLEAAFREPPMPGIASAYLFGSHAEGRAHRESDVDVGVLLDWSVHPSRAGRFDIRVRLGSWLIGVLHVNAVDVVVLNDVAPHLGRRIVTTGRRLASADPEADHAYVRDVQLRAADLEPFLRRMRRIKLEAIGR
jgi:predicted nucleotidyltransferase